MDFWGKKQISAQTADAERKQCSSSRRQKPNISLKRFITKIKLSTLTDLWYLYTKARDVSAVLRVVTADLKRVAHTWHRNRVYDNIRGNNAA